MKLSGKPHKGCSFNDSLRGAATQSQYWTTFTQSPQGASSPQASPSSFHLPLHFPVRLQWVIRSAVRSISHFISFPVSRTCIPLELSREPKRSVWTTSILAVTKISLLPSHKWCKAIATNMPPKTLLSRIHSFIDLLKSYMASYKHILACTPVAHILESDEENL